MRKIALALFFIILLILPLTACSTPAEMTVEQLMSNPERYNGDVVVVSGFYFHGFETMVLCESLKYSGLAEGHLIPEGEMMWFESGLPSEVFDNLYIQSDMGPEERYGKIRVKGKFETGGQYGHLGAHHSRITYQEVELLPWSPPAPD
jgi:hypothetical protein